MDSPEQMAAAYRAEMRRLLDAVNRIPTELLAAPIHRDWTVREVLVHLAGWDRAVAASAETCWPGQPARLTAMRLEDVNEDIVEAKRDAPLEQVRRELMEAHQQLLDRLAELSPEQWHATVPGKRWSDGAEPVRRPSGPGWRRPLGWTVSQPSPAPWLEHSGGEDDALDLVQTTPVFRVALVGKTPHALEDVGEPIGFLGEADDLVLVARPVAMSSAQD